MSRVQLAGPNWPVNSFSNDASRYNPNRPLAGHVNAGYPDFTYKFGRYKGYYTPQPSNYGRRTRDPDSALQAAAARFGLVDLENQDL